MNRLANYVRYLTARITKRGKYQVVVTLPLRSGATETFTTNPTDHRSAVQDWRWRMASGLFVEGTGRSAQVMSVAEVRKAGIR